MNVSYNVPFSNVQSKESNYIQSNQKQAIKFPNDDLPLI